MLNNDKIQEFLLKLAPCIERGDLDACLEEAARLAREMGLEAREMRELSTYTGMNGKHNFAYVLALVAAQDLEGGAKSIAYSNAGLSAQYLKKYEKAEKLYKQAFEADSNYAMAHYNYANLLYEQKKNDEAEEHYKQAIKADPKNANAHNNYANLLHEQKRNDLAEKHYKLAIEADPKNADAHNNYANLLREKSMFLDAEKEVRNALQIQPNYSYALGTYGDILADEDYLEEAIEKYHEAIKYSDSMAYMAKAEIHNNLGWVYANLEQYDRAKKKFEEAHKLDPQNVKVIRNIRALGKVKSEPKISKMQWRIAIVLFAGVIATWYLFLTKKLTENIFSVQTIILIAMIIFILFYHQLSKFKAGPIEFEKSTEHRNQLSEAKAKIKR